MAKTVVGAQMYTVRDFCTTATDTAAAMQRLMVNGYRAVQISGVRIDDARELRKMLDDNGLVCAATHVATGKFQTDLNWVVDYHKTLGCKHSAVGGMPGEYRNGDGFVRFAKEFSEIARKLKKQGLTFSYHNHSFELEKFNGRTGLDILMEESNPKVFMMEIDTYWIQHGGGDPAAWIGKARGRIPLLHLKDMTVRTGKGPIMAEVGEGNLNWKKILAAAKKAGVKWYLVEQDTCERDPFESLKRSLDNLKAMGLKN